MGTLYLYISKKEDLLFLLCHSEVAEITASLTAVPKSSSPRKQLHQQLTTLFDVINSKRRELNFLYRESASIEDRHLDVIKQLELQQVQAIAQTIREGVEEGIFSSVLEPEVIAHTAVFLSHMWALKGWALWERTQFAQYREHQINQFLYGLLREKIGAEEL